MEEKAKCKQCYKCGCYTAYYKKGHYKFTKVERGYCKSRREVVENHGGCEKWCTSSFNYSEYRKQAVQKMLNEILSQLAQIRQVMEENAENEAR